MTDFEKMQKCAVAMGLLNVIQSTDGIGNQKLHIATGPFMREYDPLHNDEQAMALVKKFGLTLDPAEDEPPFTWRVAVAGPGGDWERQIFKVNTDLNRAIVECVANLTP